MYGEHIEPVLELVYTAGEPDAPNTLDDITGGALRVVREFPFLIGLSSDAFSVDNGEFVEKKDHIDGEG